MLKEGATSFWEEYNPNKKGTEQTFGDVRTPLWKKPLPRLGF